MPDAVGNLWKLQALSSDGYTGGDTESVTVTVTVNVQYADATTVSMDFTFNIIIIDIVILEPKVYLINNE